MNVIRARVMGYCMGVQKAVLAAENALKQEKATCRSVYTLGPLIHNPSVIRSFEERGLRVLGSDSLERIEPSSVVIIRAHGTTPNVLSALEKSATKVIDATCPKVHLSQRRAHDFAQKGFTVVLAGDRNHGEVVSIAGYAESAREGSSCVVQNESEAEDLALSGSVMLLSQTTFSPAEFGKITRVIKKKCPDAVVFNSICSATMERQKALIELEGKAEGILVIGGKNSANTKRLYETAQNICPNVALVENAREIPELFFSLKTVALTSGASTPEHLVCEVENVLLGRE